MAALAGCEIFIVAEIVNSRCFVPSCRVAVPGGRKRIGDLKVGDAVWSWDTERGVAVVRRVGDVIRSRRDRVVRLTAGELVIPGVTSDHPVWEPQPRRWTEVQDLGDDATLLAWMEGADAKEVALTARSEIVGDVEVIDLTIDGPEHNFFVEGLLVHNKSDDDDSAFAEDDPLPFDDDDAADAPWDDIERACDNEPDTAFDCILSAGEGLVGFSDTAVGGRSSAELQLRNLGATACELSATFVGDPAFAFSDAEPLPTRMLEFAGPIVTFRPEETGLHWAELILTGVGDDGNAACWSIVLHGTGAP